MKKYEKMLEDIIQQYNGQNNIYLVKMSYGDRCWCELEYKLVRISKADWEHPNADSIFDVLHEIGHLMTNTLDMKVYYQEYLATQWAIEHMGDYNLKISEQRKKDFQDYIERWRQFAISHHAKNVHNIEEITLQW